MHKTLILSTILITAMLVGCNNKTSQVKTKCVPYDFEYIAYTKLLSDNVNYGLVDYKNIKKNRALLDSLVDALASAELANTTPTQRMAFYINAYNILTIRSIIDAYPVESIKDIDGVWKVKKWAVAGHERTLNEIEHSILRKEFAESRIHVAINCASIGCPPLLEIPYYPNKIDSLLTISSQRFANSTSHNNIDFKNNIAQLSAIFDWFGDDFVARYYNARRFSELDQKESASLAFIIDNLSQTTGKKLSSKIANIRYLDYDWSLNEQKK